MKNLGAILEEAGSSYEKTIKTVCFLADMGDFGAFNEVYGKYFTEKPARSCVAVKELPKNVLCEVEVIKIIDNLLSYYKENGLEKERLSSFIDRVGIQEIKQSVI